MLISWFSGCMQEHPYYIGDGNCDDFMNNEGCSYDGGDCCGPNVNTQYCTECICYTDMDCVVSLALIGNGFCNDEANTAGCSYDGGDCCRECINTDLCTECICQDGGEPAIDLSCKLLMMIKFSFLECKNIRLLPKLNYKTIVFEVGVGSRKRVIEVTTFCHLIGGHLNIT